MAETASISTPVRDPMPLVVGVIAAQVIGGLATQMSPFIIAGLMQGLSLSERDAGFVASVELLSLAITALVVAPVLPKVSCRRVALIATVLTLVAQAVSMLGTTETSLTLLRGIAGIGEGALYAVSLSVVAARSANPDRIYGYFQIVWALGSVVLFAGGGQLTGTFAYRGVFGLMVGVSLLLTPLLLLLPANRASSTEGAAVDTGPGSRTNGVLALTVIGLYVVVSAGVYAFCAPLGARAGLDTSAVGYALTLSTLVGLFGAGAATALNIRWGRMIPITGFFVAFAIATVALCLWRSPIAYVVAIVVSAVIYYFSLPYLFGLAAALDRTGRWAAAAGSAFLLGYAAGPLAAGVVIDAAGYAGLAAASLVVTIVAFALAVVVIRRVDGVARAAAYPQA